MSRLIQVATIDELADSQVKAIEVGGEAIALFKVGDRFFAIENRCPHANYTLHDGDLDGEIVTCLLHGAQFDVSSGNCVGGLSCNDVETFPITITDNGEILIELP